MPCYSQLSLEIQASFSDFDDESGVRATAFFFPPVVFGCSIVWLVSASFVFYKAAPFLML